MSGLPDKCNNLRCQTGLLVCSPCGCCSSYMHAFVCTVAVLFLSLGTCFYAIYSFCVRRFIRNTPSCMIYVLLDAQFAKRTRWLQIKWDIWEGNRICKSYITQKSNCKVFFIKTWKFKILHQLHEMHFYTCCLYKAKKVSWQSINYIDNYIIKPFVFQLAILLNNKVSYT